LDVPEPPGGEDHFEITLPNGLRLMWDTEELIRKLDPEWTRPEGHAMALAFECKNAADVNETYRRLTEAGFTGKKDPYDACWGQQTPAGFTFAVKMPLTRLDRVGTFVERVRALGDRLGPLRVTVQSPRDDGLLTFLQGSLPAGLDVAYDFRHESWDAVEGVVRVNDLDAEP